MPYSPPFYRSDPGYEQCVSTASCLEDHPDTMAALRTVVPHKYAALFHTDESASAALSTAPSPHQQRALASMGQSGSAPPPPMYASAQSIDTHLSLDLLPMSNSRGSGVGLEAVLQAQHSARKSYGRLQERSHTQWHKGPPPVRLMNPPSPQGGRVETDTAPKRRKQERQTHAAEFLRLQSPQETPRKVLGMSPQPVAVKLDKSVVPSQQQQPTARPQSAAPDMQSRTSLHSEHNYSASSQRFVPAEYIAYGRQSLRTPPREYRRYDDFEERKVYSAPRLSSHSDGVRKPYHTDPPSQRPRGQRLFNSAAPPSQGDQATDAHPAPQQHSPSSPDEGTLSAAVGFSPRTRRVMQQQQQGSQALASSRRVHSARGDGTRRHEAWLREIYSAHPSPTRTTRSSGYGQRPQSAVGLYKSEVQGSSSAVHGRLSRGPSAVAPGGAGAHLFPVAPSHNTPMFNKAALPSPRVAAAQWAAVGSPSGRRGGGTTGKGGNTSTWSTTHTAHKDASFRRSDHSLRNAPRNGARGDVVADSVGRGHAWHSNGRSLSRGAQVQQRRGLW